MSDNIKERLYDRLQKEFEKKVSDKALEIAEMLVTYIGKKEYTAGEAMPYIIATIAKQQVEIELLTKKIKQLERESNLTEMLMSDKGFQGNS